MGATQTELRVTERPWFNKLLILVAAATWGFSFVVMKDLVERVPVFWLLTVRYLLSTLAMVAVLRGRLLRSLRERRALTLGLALGVLNFAAYATQTVGLSLTTPGKNAFFTGCYCVMVPFVGWAFGRGRPRFRHVLAACLCVTGIGLVALGGVSALNAGDVLTLVCAVCYALQYVVLATWGHGTDALSITTIEFAVMGALSSLVTLVAERGFVPSAPTVADLGAMAFLVLVCSCFNFAAINRGMLHVDPTEGSILSSLEAPFGELASVLFYAEPDSEDAARLLPRLRCDAGLGDGGGGLREGPGGGPANHPASRAGPASGMGAAVKALSACDAGVGYAASAGRGPARRGRCARGSRSHG